MGSWLDLISVGINAAQSYQIHQAKEQLRRMEEGAAAEALRAQVLEVMRSYVFEISQDIRALEDHLQTSPQQVYVVAHALRWRLDEMGLTPDVFPEFADKEYVQQTQNKISYALRVSQNTMSPQQRHQAETAIKFITQADLLSDAVEAMAAKEELQAMEAEWQELSQEAKQASNKKTMGCLALVATFTIVPIFLVSVATMMGNLSGFLGSISGLVGLAVWIAALVGSIMLVSRGSNPARYEELKAEREALESKLMPQERWDQVVGLWGQRASHQYRAIQESRNNFLRGVFASVDGFDRFLPVNN
jgi:hypothetical protein